ncbi:hypothetical protein GCM10029978_117400 [Actinoallomurus acanthiterrae]
MVRRVHRIDPRRRRAMPSAYDATHFSPSGSTRSSNALLPGRTSGSRSFVRSRASVWDKIDGGYIPDVDVNTGTQQPVRGSCGQ